MNHRERVAARIEEPRGRPEAPPGDEVHCHYLGEGLSTLLPSFPEAAGIRARMRRAVPRFSDDKLTHFSRGGHC